MSFTVSLFAKCRLLGNSKVTTDIMYSFNLRFVLQRSLSQKNDYEEAVEKLNYLQSNSTVLKQCQQRVARGLNSRSNSDTKMYLKRIGITAEEIDSGLSVIHVSGTKGKGSTCAYCESVLRQYGYKTGFYSSPHLVAVRERIRINGQPLSESDFAYYFWDVYTKLEANRDDYNGAMPFYFSFLTVMAVRIFLAEKVDVAIIEVGIGGENDSTNIFSNTPVVGITSLGLDHTTLLGDTVDKIAWQKAGIMKKKSITITASNQPASALKVLYDRAKEKQCVLLEAPSISEYKWNSNSELSDLNLSGTINPINASVGLQLAYAWLTKCKNRGSLENIGKGFKLEEESIEGIKNCFWPGRQQVITRRNGDFKYFIDGAHTVESMSECSYWFKEQTKGENSTRVLLFNITSDRDALSLLKPLLSCYFDVAIFCTNIATNRITNSSDLANFQTTVERQIQRTKENALCWIDTNQKHIMDNESKEKITKTFDTVEESVHFIENLSGKNNVLVTGSLHLIGAFFSVIGPDLILHRSNGVN